MHFALQFNTNDPMFWVMVVIALSFIIMAIAMVSIAVFVSRAVKSVNRLEEKLEPLIEKVTAVSEQGKQIAVQANILLSKSQQSQIIFLLPRCISPNRWQS